MQSDSHHGLLGRHALVNAVQQFLDKARARLSGGELQRAATLELPLGTTEPMPRASTVSEDLLTKRGNASQAHGSIRFIPAQSLMPRSRMRQRASRHDQRVDLVGGDRRRPSIAPVARRSSTTLTRSWSERRP